MEEHVHYWIIDSYNVGRCKDCPEVRDFGKLSGDGRLPAI